MRRHGCNNSESGGSGSGKHDDGESEDGIRVVAGDGSRCRHRRAGLSAAERQTDRGETDGNTNKPRTHEGNAEAATHRPRRGTAAAGGARALGNDAATADGLSTGIPRRPYARHLRRWPLSALLGCRHRHPEEDAPTAGTKQRESDSVPRWKATRATGRRRDVRVGRGQR
jgi:hypothetical protein